MNRLYIISIIILLAIGNSIGQVENEIPHLETNPDHFIQTEKIIDSIIQYAYFSHVDSSLLRKWEYKQQDNNNINQSYHYYYSKIKDEWRLQGRYDYSFDKSGNCLLQEHYHWQNYNNTWRGCSQEGCGKKEWLFDANDSLILKTQSYWNKTSRSWDLHEEWENEYVLDGSLVLKSYKYSEEYNSGREWYGEKDEYSYDINGDKTGHIKYRWTGGDPYDWMPINKAEWHYNSYNQLGSVANYQWVSGRWIGYIDDWASNLWSKAENTYDSNGKITSVNLYTWDYGKDNWVLYHSEPVFYNSDGQILSGLEFNYYDYGYIVDIPVQRNEFTYDTDGRLISQVKYSFYEYFVKWPEPAGIDTILFNSEGLIISEISWYWYRNWGGGPYLAYDKNNYDYDDKGNKILQLGYKWDDSTGTWQENNKSIWEYNENGNMVRHSGYNWDPYSNNWVGSRKYEYDFDDKGNKVLNLSFDWSNTTNDWVYSSKSTNQFDSSGNNISERSFIWNSERSDWDGITRRDREFDQNDRLIMVARYAWDHKLSAWIGEDEKMSWEYSPEGTLTAETSCVWDTIQNDWQNKISIKLILDDDDDPLSSSQCSWNPNNNEWEPVIKNYYYYNNSTTSKEDIEVNHINLFPNPASGFINITGLTEPANIKIYNLQGQLLKSFNQVQNTIDLSDLNKGFYILNLEVGGKKVVRKIVRE